MEKAKIGVILQHQEETAELTAAYMLIDVIIHHPKRITTCIKTNLENTNNRKGQVRLVPT
jgi:hypothetical protein